MEKDCKKTTINNNEIKKGDILYVARIIPSCGIYEIIELKIRTVEDTYFVGTDKYTKQAFLYGYGALETKVFRDRNKALQLVKKAEANGKKISDEKCYEEY